MPTALQGRATQAAPAKSYRLRHLLGLRPVASGRSGWALLQKRAAAGGDRSSARAYGSRRHDHGTSRVERVNNQGDRAQVVRRHAIPQGHGALRPLGIPATADTRLQRAGARSLEAISAPDLLPRRDGSRQKLGAREAVRDRTRHRPCGPYRSVGEAAITGDGDHSDPQRLRERLRWRRDARPCLRRSEQWCKAGVGDTDGQGRHPVTGLPHGGMVSPILAHSSLHHGLDGWLTDDVQAQGTGQAILCRDAEDGVCAFQDERDAERCSRG